VDFLVGYFQHGITCKDDFKAYVTAAGILLEGPVKDLNQSLKLLNCYGPYSERQAFWETVKEEGLFNESNLVMGGDLNLTTSCREVWGDSARVDPLQLYFSQLFQEGGWWMRRRLSCSLLGGMGEGVGIT
jgi:hypothetical protein